MRVAQSSRSLGASSPSAPLLLLQSGVQAGVGVTPCLADSPLIPPLHPGGATDPPPPFISWSAAAVPSALASSWPPALRCLPPDGHS